MPGRKSARVQGIRGNAEQLSAEDQSVFRWLVVGEDFISNNRGINEGEDIPQDASASATCKSRAPGSETATWQMLRADVAHVI